MWAGVKAAATLLFVERDGERRVGTHGVTSPPPSLHPPWGARYAARVARKIQANSGKFRILWALSSASYTYTITYVFFCSAALMIRVHARRTNSISFTLWNLLAWLECGCGACNIFKLLLFQNIDTEAYIACIVLKVDEERKVLMTFRSSSVTKTLFPWVLRLEIIQASTRKWYDWSWFKLIKIHMRKLIIKNAFVRLLRNLGSEAQRHPKLKWHSEKFWLNEIKDIGVIFKSDHLFVIKHSYKIS